MDPTRVHVVWPRNKGAPAFSTEREALTIASFSSASLRSRSAEDFFVTVSPEIEAQIQLAHFVGHWPVGTIATQLGVHHDAVRSVLGIDVRNAEPKKRAQTSQIP